MRKKFRTAGPQGLLFSVLAFPVSFSFWTIFLQFSFFLAYLLTPLLPVSYHDMDVTIKVSVEEGAKVEAPESDPANLSDLTETIWSAVQPRIQQLKDLIAKLDFTEDEVEGLPEE